MRPPRSCAGCSTARSSRRRRPRTRLTFSASRSSPPSPWTSGTRTPSTALVRRAYPYRDLLAQRVGVRSRHGLGPLPDMCPVPATPRLQARIAWDRANNRLTALPGTRLLALNNPGTIPDTGAYDVYLADGKTRVGTLDEEFIFETRPGDVFMLGSSVWRVAGARGRPGDRRRRARATPAHALLEGRLSLALLRTGRAHRRAAPPGRRANCRQAGETGTPSSPRSSATTRSISTRPARSTTT